MASSVTAAERYDHPLDVVKPFVWIGALSFATGFWGYMAVSSFFHA